MASRICHRQDTWHTSTCLAWIVMPDHWHGLIELGDEPLGRVMGRFKAAVARELHRSGMWQEGFHDRCLRSDQNLHAAARYIVANPVRAGIAPSVMEYPYWHTVWL
ncbi:REP element-mobilizing transposase RayT [Luteibacter sp. 3190]|nr:REP element-mobilizing transposase RayT [Luteibacter sp. 3190]